MEKIKVESMVLGPVAANCYFVKNRETGELLLVDAPALPERIAQKIADCGGVLKGILLTHGHFDHIGAVDELRRRYQVPVYAMEPEEDVLESADSNLSELFGHPLTIKADCLLKDRQELTLAGISIQAILTPGHTRGGGCYYIPEEGIVFSGDTLFCESVGRSDFPTGSTSALVRSVRDKLLTLPEETIVYPGHNTTTTIGYEKENNPFL